MTQAHQSQDSPLRECPQCGTVYVPANGNCTTCSVWDLAYSIREAVWMWLEDQPGSQRLVDSLQHQLPQSATDPTMPARDAIAAVVEHICKALAAERQRPKEQTG
jgi:hypothetical protein